MLRRWRGWGSHQFRKKILTNVFFGPFPYPKQSVLVIPLKSNLFYGPHCQRLTNLLYLSLFDTKVFGFYKAHIWSIIRCCWGYEWVEGDQVTALPTNIFWGIDHNLVCSVHPVHHFKTASSWEELLWMHQELSTSGGDGGGGGEEGEGGVWIEHACPGVVSKPGALGALCQRAATQWPSLPTQVVL